MKLKIPFSESIEPVLKTDLGCVSQKHRKPIGFQWVYDVLKLTMVLGNAAQVVAPHCRTKIQGAGLDLHLRGGDGLRVFLSSLSY